MTLPSGTGGSSTLAGDTDVAFTSLANTNILQYSSASSKWVNASTLFLTSTATASYNAMQLTAPSIATSTFQTHLIGTNTSNYNYSYFQFWYGASGSTSNFCRLGVGGTNGLTITGTGNTTTQNGAVLDDGSGNMNLGTKSLACGSVTASGSLNGPSATIAGNVTANSITCNGALTASGTISAPNVQSTTGGGYFQGGYPSTWPSNTNGGVILGGQNGTNNAFIQGSLSNNGSAGAVTDLILQPNGGSVVCSNGLKVGGSVLQFNTTFFNSSQTLNYGVNFVTTAVSSMSMPAALTGGVCYIINNTPSSFTISGTIYGANNSSTGAHVNYSMSSGHAFQLISDGTNWWLINET